MISKFKKIDIYGKCVIFLTSRLLCYNTVTHLSQAGDAGISRLIATCMTSPTTLQLPKLPSHKRIQVNTAADYR